MQSFRGFCLILLLCSTPAAGRDIFVDNTAGDDRFSGHETRSRSDLTGPVRTIARALRLAANGDNIVLANTNRPYRESITLEGNRHSGLARQPFSIRGNGAVLDGSAPVPPKAWENYAGAVFRFRPQHVEYQQLFLDDRPATRVSVSPSAGGPPELKPRQWCLLGSYIYFCVGSAKLPADYKLAYAHHPTGITLFHVDRVTIADLTVQGFQLDGINLYNSARHVSLVGVTCRGNGRSGVAVGGASLAEIDSCLLSDNGLAQLLTLPCSETHVRNSHLPASTAPGWVDRGGLVYFDGNRVQGGRDEFHPAAEQEKNP